MEEDKRTQRVEMKDCETLPLCPSFNIYSSANFAEIAANVTERLCADEAPPSETSNDLDEDFEFALLRSDGDVTAAEISFDGQIGQVFPIFNRDLVRQDDWNQRDDNKPDISTARLTLKKLFIEKRDELDHSSSSSSSEVDELEAVPAGTYCVWRPNVVQPSPSRCKKSNSTGSESKGWKFLDLLRRSNSDGKDSFVFLTPKNREGKAERIKRVDTSKERRNSGGDGVKEARKLKAKGVANGGEGSPSAHELFYVRNRASKEGDKRKSFLPYRRDLVGFFASVNSVGKAFPPF